MTTDAKAVRRYNAGVERALGLWDATNEWADYIAFLSRLAKALQASPPGAEVPFKSTLAKYLALCLKPSLPSGVHQKALEIYNVIFTLLGRHGLSQDLPIWLPGVSHTLTFATLKTRPLFLSLYDDHILKLPSKALRPALRAIILSLLPGIEEENSEDFERTFKTLACLRQAFADDSIEELFWQSLFLASITSTSRRPGALVYLTRQLPKLGTATIHSSNGSKTDISDYMEEAIRVVTTPEPGLLVRCFATGLQDEQPLVQRGFLDLLVSHLPLDAPNLQTRVAPKDLDILVTAALSAVLRRDMGLNRRLWTWFVGREDKREGSADITHGSAIGSGTSAKSTLQTPMLSRQEYFAAYGLKSVTRSLETMLQSPSPAPADRARPFRIMLSLMDRWIIGKLPVETLFVPAMQDLQSYQTSAPSQSSFDEVFRSANVFFDAVEPQLITQQLLELLTQGKLDLIEFVLTNFNLQEEEMITIHLPTLCLAVSEMLLRDKTPAAHKETRSVLLRTTTLLESLLNLLPPHSPVSSLEASDKDFEQGWLDRLTRMYKDSSYVKKDIFDAIPPTLAAQILLRNIAILLLRHLSASGDQTMLMPLVNCFAKAIARTNTMQALRQLKFGEQLIVSLNHLAIESTASYEKNKLITKIVDNMYAFDSEGGTLTVPDQIQLVPELTANLWHALLPSTPQYHVEAVDQIWGLRLISQELLLVDSKIAALMSVHSPLFGHSEEQLARFATFWTHTHFPEANIELFSSEHQQNLDDEVPWAMLRQPVLNIIDSVDPARAEDRRRMWLNNLPTLHPILRIVFAGSLESSGSRLSLLCLHRLKKVMTLARQSPVQKADTFGQAGLSERLLEICVQSLNSSRSDKELFTTSLAIVRMLIEETELHNDPTLIAILMRLLQEVPLDGALQEEILELLQIMFAKQNAHSPPEQLLQILMTSISSTAIDSTIDKWVTLMCNVVPLYPTQAIFANMLKLTACFCDRVKEYYGCMRRLYDASIAEVQSNGDRELLSAKHPERSLNNLLAGLEYILARAHTYLVDQVSPADASIASSAEKSRSRSMANHRLTVILCMQDTIKLCGEIWAWRMVKRPTKAIADSKSFGYISARLRTRTRRILEHLSDAEPQECLETLMGMWVDAAHRNAEQDVVLNLMQSLDGARPRFMMPATFNAIYNRTNPSALDQSQKSSLSVNVDALELMAFLIAYTTALEDDLLEEIWTDCTAFLREVLGNPMPHRQILLKLLEFVAVLCKKMENTNFGEVSKMRRELSDLCARLFTAIFTIRPAGIDSASQSQLYLSNTAVANGQRKRTALESGTAIEVLCEALPVISSALGDQDRLSLTLAGVATNITGPALRSKQSPQTLNVPVLQLVLLMAKLQPNNKAWKKDAMDTLNDNKFFQSPFSLVESGWLPVLRQLSASERGIVADIVSRITPPTTAGIMFGVGATATRTEADRKTQLNLRRIALLLLASEADVFFPDLIQVLRRVEELLTATSSSSPSSNTRGEIYLLLRAIALSFSQIHLVSIWPMVDMELHDLLRSIQAQDTSLFSSHAQLQGAKLLDLLLLLKPEEFQLHEWLFVTDTVDAVYQPHDFEATAIADQMVSRGKRETELPASSENGAKKPWLCSDLTRTTEDPQLLLRPFFRQLSIHAFEDTYSLQGIDLEACRKDLLADLFVD